MRGKTKKRRKGEKFSCSIIMAFTHVKGSEMLQAVNIINIPLKDTTSS